MSATCSITGCSRPAHEVPVLEIYPPVAWQDITRSVVTRCAIDSDEYRSFADACASAG